ncbi:hypothetical protein XENOCAPTIV_009930 [Xenoophorus captivus]|uniref:Uncharacterized protein n=1 Tax=Xenoophorus captivus TaxID=1517983 RepID=A0ABV0RGR8_9TELE
MSGWRMLSVDFTELDGVLTSEGPEDKSRRMRKTGNEKLVESGQDVGTGWKVMKKCRKHGSLQGRPEALEATGGKHLAQFSAAAAASPHRAVPEHLPLSHRVSAGFRSDGAADSLA